ncbi:MAG: cyclic nucleotide-binding domain-containing protein [Acidiferrobacterales bacterium]
MTASEASSLDGQLFELGVGRGYQTELRAMLQGSNLFGDLSERQIETLAKYLRAYAVKQDASIFVEGQHARFMCIIMQGRVKILKDSGGGRTKAIAEAGTGKSLGEMAMIDDLPNSATVVAVEPVKLVTLTREDFTRLVDENPKLAAKILWRFAKIMSERLRDTSGMLADSLDLLTQ